MKFVYAINFSLPHENGSICKLLCKGSERAENDLINVRI